MPVAQHDLPGLQREPDRVAVPVPVGGDQTRHRLTAVLVRAAARQVAERGVRRLPGGQHRDTLLPQQPGDRLHGRALADAAGALDRDEQARPGGHEFTPINGRTRVCGGTTGHSSVSTSPIRWPAATTAAGQPFPQEDDIEQLPHVGFAPTVHRSWNR